MAFTDGQVPTADDLNSLAAGAIEVYDNMLDRDLAGTPELGQVVWIRDVGALDVWVGSEWVQLAAVSERQHRVTHTQRTPVTLDWWLAQVSDLSATYQARHAGLAGIGGAPDASPQPSAGGAQYWHIDTPAQQAHAGSSTYDHAREVPYYELDLSDAAALATIDQTPNSGGVSYQQDGDWVTLVFCGVAAWRTHLTTRAQVIAVGAGGYGGASGFIHIQGSDETSPVGGGGGGGGGVSSAVVDVTPGQTLIVRAGGSTQTYADTGDVAKRDGIAIDCAGASTACWLDSRPLVAAGGGSRGGTHYEVALGGVPAPPAYFLGGGSQGGAAALSGHVSDWPPQTQWLRQGSSSRGGAGGSVSLVGDVRLMSSGGGGGGAISAGGDGETMDYTNTLGTFAIGGAGGDGVATGWRGIPELGTGGDGGWAGGYPGAVTVPAETGTTYGAGGAGGNYWLDASAQGGSGGSHLRSAHTPGLGVVLVRYRTDGGTFTETDLSV